VGKGTASSDADFRVESILEIEDLFLKD
jgi:hypothetical protein